MTYNLLSLFASFNMVGGGGDSGGGGGGGKAPHILLLCKIVH